MGEGGAIVRVWGRSLQPQKANGALRPQLPEARGLGVKFPSAGSKGVWGRSPQRSTIFTIFQKKLRIFRLKFQL